MKRSIFLFLILVFVIKCFGQNWTVINFDDSVELYRISIDTTITGNIWQIGQPQKSAFNSAYSLPNSITTDTIDTYPSNNTSVFYLGTGGDWLMDSHRQSLNFRYRMDSDSLNDYGKIEISLDTGQTWQNILLTENGSGFHWWVEDSIGAIVIQPALGDTLVFTGSTHGWYRFKSEIHLLELQYYDTIIYRFTFKTDGNVDNRDGWVIDDIGYHIIWEGVSDSRNSTIVYPNPANTFVNIQANKLINQVKIIDLFGISLKVFALRSYYSMLDIDDLKTGLYYCSILFEDGTKRCVKLIKYK